jgi:uncharacterized protein YyaL (SSP411 family)
VTPTTLPGAAPFPPELAARIAAAQAARGRSYVLPTHHADEGRPRYTNRLVLETSPYLLQHAHNPVAWWPWCDEAFEAARAAGRPVFLSIGYSTCHWCHVMERESFEDEEIARYLNEHFVAIKVDREERPDVDAVYMTAVQALTGSGGWPMSVFLDADRTPFFGGTYFPARDGDRGAPRGFLSVLQELVAVWERDPARVRKAGSALGEAVRAALAGPPEPSGEVPGDEPILEAVRLVEGAFDPVHGGVGHAPKFPSSVPVRLLLRHHRRSHDPASLHVALFSLERMAAGGLMDQIGGGFHRYATDARWLVPHFEKMLYDNALLAVAYLEAWQVTGRRDLARVARQTIEYVLREMTSPEGAFYSATDADSEGEEGRFFVWSEPEIRAVLGDGAERFIAYYGITPEGNFEGRNIPWVKQPDEDAWEALAGARQRLYEHRERRVHPSRDEKIVAGWNALMISALATGGRLLAEPRWIEAASRAARFVLDRMRPSGRLARTVKDGVAGPPGYLQDHAFLVQALLDLHEATFDPGWLEEALAVADVVEQIFADPRGGWFVSGADQERLIAREKPSHDGAEPSGASVALLDAVRLEAFTGDDRWRTVAERALRWYAPLLHDHPTAMTEMLLALDAFTDTPREVVLVWPPGTPPPEGFLEVLRRTFLPNRALTGAEQGEPQARLARVARIVEGRLAASGKPTAYVCERGACRLPAISPDKLAAQLKPVRPYSSS